MPLPPLNAEALAPFAIVLRAAEGRAQEFAPVMERGDVPGHHAFTILCPQPAKPDAVIIRTLERHPHSTQTFVPIRAGRWIVLVAPTFANGDPDLNAFRAFIAGPEDAICIRRNVWHAGLTVLDRPAEMGMIMWKADAGDDGVVYPLPQPIGLDIDNGTGATA